MAKFKDCPKWLNQGKKVRREHWAKSSYLYIAPKELDNLNPVIRYSVTKEPAYFGMNFFNVDDWEVCEEDEFMVCCVCGRCDEMLNAYCSYCGRVPHRIMNRESLKKFRRLLKELD